MLENKNQEYEKKALQWWFHLYRIIIDPKQNLQEIFSMYYYNFFYSKFFILMLVSKNLYNLQIMENFFID